MFSKLKFRMVGQNTDKQLKTWKRTSRRPELAAHSPLQLPGDASVLTIGSCFVNEIRAILESTDLNLFPRLDPAISDLFHDGVKSNPAWGTWDERVHYQCFTPFTIEQEVNIAFGKLEMDPSTIVSRKVKGDQVFVDPCRRQVFAGSKADALQIRDRMNQRMREGFEKADVIIMTLGLVEAFRLSGTPLFVSEYSRVLGDDALEYVEGNYETVDSSLDRSISTIHQHFPDKQIILTVSPIPMARTFSDDDVITATTRGKSILRACVDRFVRDNANVHYWPSYEFAMWRGDAFREDLRHIRREVVADITTAFCKAYFPPDVSKQILKINPDRHRSPSPGLFKRIKTQLRRVA